MPLPPPTLTHPLYIPPESCWVLVVCKTQGTLIEDCRASGDWKGWVKAKERL